MVGNHREPLHLEFFKPLAKSLAIAKRNPPEKNLLIFCPRTTIFADIQSAQRLVWSRYSSGSSHKVEREAVRPDIRRRESGRLLVTQNVHADPRQRLSRIVATKLLFLTLAIRIWLVVPL
jgi:hypothetical protein